MEIIDVNGINEARRQIDKLHAHGKEIIVVAKDMDFNRKILENKKIDVLLFSGYFGNRKKLKQRDSGLNHILCRIAKENGISIGINFSDFLGKDSFKLSELLSSTMQNIRLCRKFGVKILIFNTAGRDKSEITSFFLTLGMQNPIIKNLDKKSLLMF
ncbi:MAG: RNase P subunit p30 family protein [Candidatus Pacearchaeota archaeon]